jgi:hypothetical protein
MMKWRVFGQDISFAARGEAAALWVVLSGVLISAPGRSYADEAAKAATPAAPAAVNPAPAAKAAAAPPPPSSTPAAPASAAAGAPPPGSPTPAEQTALPAPRSPAGKQPDSPGRFEPSEKVRSDFDVSFPVDM